MSRIPFDLQRAKIIVNSKASMMASDPSHYEGYEAGSSGPPSTASSPESTGSQRRDGLALYCHDTRTQSAQSVSTRVDEVDDDAMDGESDGGIVLETLDSSPGSSGDSVIPKSDDSDVGEDSDAKGGGVSLLSQGKTPVVSSGS